MAISDEEQFLGGILTSVNNKRSGLEDFPFSYRESKSGKVFISWRDKQVMILNGKKAESFLTRIASLDDLEQQLVLAKITGNFKRGNERQ